MTKNAWSDMKLNSPFHQYLLTVGFIVTTMRDFGEVGGNMVLIKILASQADYRLAEQKREAKKRKLR